MILLKLLYRINKIPLLKYQIVLLVSEIQNANNGQEAGQILGNSKNVFKRDAGGGREEEFLKKKKNGRKNRNNLL